MVEIAPFGTWPSPLTAEVLARAGVRLDGPAVRDDEVWWAEMRPAEAGRVVLVRRTADGEPVDVLPAPFSARTLVHEYGGGSWWLGATDTYLANMDDQRLYRLPADGGAPQPLTPEPPTPRAWRFADGAEHPSEPWLVAVRERHGDGSEAVNELVLIGLDGAPDPVIVAASATGPQSDFVAAPRFSPDGRWLSWIRWNHPAMPWDATELCLAPVSVDPDGRPTVGDTVVVAGDNSGGPRGGESIHGANWLADGRLVFSTDRSGFWNLHAWSPGPDDGTDRPLTALVGAEIGYPPWVFGIQQWTELGDGRIAAIVTSGATDSLAVLHPGDDATTTEPRPLPSAFTSIQGIAATERNTLVVHGATPTETASLLELDLDGAEAVVHRPADDTGVDAGWFSTATPMWFDIDTGASPARRVQAFVYTPAAPGYQGPDGERPPLVVMGHGGPTSHAPPALNLRIQYWTSRGVAVADVNYGGSSGFGRDYRRLLDDNWGVVDVEDCIGVATRLAADGVVDAERMAIRGGSAGGFTTLAALTSSEVFGAGTSLFGVADLTALAADTHKFESRYLDGLVGPYPERRDLYEERSPINHTDGLSCPLLVLQGLEDEVVPPNQSEAIVAAVAAKGIPHAYVAFEGEQHGFRQAANIIRSYELELWFYSRVFGFDAADVIEPPEGAVGL
ncbi:MAG: prolyl oligopeptidase family serine peptidase [Actinomycetota bacterium]